MSDTTTPEALPEPVSEPVPEAPAALPEPSVARESVAPESVSEARPVPSVAPEPMASGPVEAAPSVEPESVEPAPSVATEAAALAGTDAPRPPRRKLRAALRWTSAVLVFAALGGATAYAVAQPERTRIPGLKTPDDGRWSYPPLALPKLPEGKPRPLVSANVPQIHYADLRSLLVPLPEGATADPAFPGAKGWLPPATYLRVYSSHGSAELAELREDGLRHVAARAWTMPDGTRTEVYLVQFLNGAYAQDHLMSAQQSPMTGISGPHSDAQADSPALPDNELLFAYQETAPYGATMARYADIISGDTMALVLQTRKGSVAAVPFRETVRLQDQLLG